MDISTSRIQWVDIAKGFAILSVVVGHSVFKPLFVWNVIYSYHMPLFFLLSGLFVINKDVNLKSAMLKRAKTLLLPYSVFSILQGLFFLSINKFVIDFSWTRLSVKTFFLSPELWFLPVLFVVSLMVIVLNKITHKKYILFAIWIISIVISIYFSYNPTGDYSYGTMFCGERLVFVRQVLFGLIFVLGGAILKEVIMKGLPIWCSVLSAFIYALFFYINFYVGNSSHVEMSAGYIGNPFFFYLVAFSAILLVIVLCQRVGEKEKVFTFLGKNSLLVYAIHWPVIKVIDLLLGRFIHSGPSILMTVLSVLITLLICVPFILFINKHARWILGRF